MNIEDPLMKRLHEISYEEYNKQSQKDRTCAYCKKPASMKKVTMKNDNLDDGFTCIECGWKIYK